MYTQQKEMQTKTEELEKLLKFCIHAGKRNHFLLIWILMEVMRRVFTEFELNSLLTKQCFLTRKLENTTNNFSKNCSKVLDERQTIDHSVFHLAVIVKTVNQVQKSLFVQVVPSG